MTMARLCFLLALLLSFTAEAVAPEQLKDMYLLQAKEANRAKNYKLAEEKFRKVEQLNVHLEPQFYYLYATILDNQGKSEAVLRKLDIYLKKTTPSGKYYQKALLLYGRHKDIVDEQERIRQQRLAEQAAEEARRAAEAERQRLALIAEQNRLRQEAQMREQLKRQRIDGAVSAIAKSMVDIPGGVLPVFCEGEQRCKEQNIYLPRFKIAAFEITRSQWSACVEDGGCKGSVRVESNKPKTNISYSQVVNEFLPWLNNKVGGKPYRLPSEMEWEYAARAGSTSLYSWGDNIDCSKARFERQDYSSPSCVSSTSDSVANVGSYQPNLFGLYDMSGNAAEWTADCGHQLQRHDDTYPKDGSPWSEPGCKWGVVRGGSAKSYAEALQLHKRSLSKRSNNDITREIGFRLARDIERKNTVNRLTVTTSPASARITVDGKPLKSTVSVQLKPALVKVKVKAQGYGTKHLLIDLRDGDAFKEVALNLLPPISMVRIPASPDAGINAFNMSATEVTNLYWDACVVDGACSDYLSEDQRVKDVRGAFSADSSPITSADLDKVLNEFLPWLNAATGKRYRLPTQDEWLHAARLGGSYDKTLRIRSSVACHLCGVEGSYYTKTSTTYSWRNQLRVANDPFAVASNGPDNLGLYDMQGNAAEFVSDCTELNTTKCDRYRVQGSSFETSFSEVDYWLSDWVEKRPLKAGIRLVEDLKKGSPVNRFWLVGIPNHAKVTLVESDLEYSPGMEVKTDELYVSVEAKGFEQGNFYIPGVSGDTAAKVSLDKQYVENRELAKELFDKAVKQYYWEEKYDDVVALLIRADELGHPYATVELGKQYLAGVVVGRDQAKGMRLVKDNWQALVDASLNGDSHAQYLRAFLSRPSFGIVDDPEVFLKWYGLASSRGYALAQNNLAAIIQNGEDDGTSMGEMSTPKDAAFYYEKAASGGYSLAEANLALLYLYGWGDALDQDIERAKQLTEKALETNNSKAMYVKGVMYMQGLGEKQSDRKAKKWLRKAAEAGYSDAQTTLDSKGW